MAGARFSRRVGETERANASEQYGPFFDEIRWDATACVFACAAGLEAYANEFYIDRSDNFPDLRKEVADAFWVLYEKKPVFEKFDVALMLRHQVPLDRSGQTYQNCGAMVDLRNALTHFKPEWEDEKDAHAKLSRKLKGKFQPSRFLPKEADVFPIQWASHGCTCWAVESAKAFIHDFEVAAGLKHKLDNFATRLIP